MGIMLLNATSVASVADVYTQLVISLDVAAGKCLVINDSTNAFQADNDIVIDVTGVAGTINYGGGLFVR